MRTPSPTRPLVATTLLLISLVMLPSCESNTVTSSPPTPTFALSLDSAAATLGTTASSARLRVNVTRMEGYDGVVNLAVEGAPDGVIASFSETSIPVTTTSSVLTLAADGAPPGDYALTVRGTGHGVTERIASLALTVSRDMDGGFTLSASPSVSIPATGATTTMVSIERLNGFTGAISLSLHALPAGLTTAVSDAGTTDAAVLSIATSQGAAPGVYTLTITGTAAGVVTQTTVVTVTVFAITGNVAFQFCDPAGLPVWFAVQSEDGAWTRVSGEHHRYLFDVGHRGGVAYSIPVTDQDASTPVYGYYTYIHYGTATELANLGAAQCLSPIAKRVRGTVTGVSATERATVGIGGAVRSFIRSSFQLGNVPDGPRDLIATRSSYRMDYSVVLTPNKMIIRRGIAPAHNTTIPTLDFGAPEAFDPVPHTVTIDGIGTDRTFRSTGYATANAGEVNLSWEFDAATGSTHVYHGVPKSRQAPGDRHTLLIHAFEASGSWDERVRTSSLWFHEAADKTVALGPALARPVVTQVADAPTRRYRVQLPVQSEYDSLFTMNISQGVDSEHGMIITASAGFRAGASVWDVAVPELSGVAGWLPQSALRADLVTKITVYATGASRHASPDGAAVLAAGRTATTTTPR